MSLNLQDGQIVQMEVSSAVHYYFNIYIYMKKNEKELLGIFFFFLSNFGHQVTLLTCLNVYNGKK